MLYPIWAVGRAEADTQFQFDDLYIYCCRILFFFSSGLRFYLDT